MATEHFRPDQPPEYHSFSGQGFTLHANADVLRTLDMLVREGLQALPGIEIGGLLLGSDTSDVRLDAAHAVAIEHRFGPSYEPSDGDIELIWQAISRVRQPSGPQIIGHFRSCATGELEVTAADLTIAALTGAPQPWMLLITASLSEPSLARLYSNPGGEFVELLAFPLAPAITEGRTISPLEAPPEQPASQPAATHGHWRTALIAAGLLLACTALVTYFRPHEPPLDHYTGRHTDKTVTTVAGPLQPIPKPARNASADRAVVDVAKQGPRNEPKRSPADPFQPPPRRLETLATSMSGAPATAMPQARLDLPLLQLENLDVPLPAPLIAALPPPELPPRLAPPPILPPSPVDVAPTFVSYVAPIPVRRVSPTVPIGLRSLIQDGTSLEVKVMIDAEGEVISATPVDASSAGRKLLSPSAVQAAMLWRFEPARRNGQPVGSETTLMFNFGPRPH